METNTEKMYAVITDINGTIDAMYTLGENDVLDCDVYAGMYAKAIGYDVTPSGLSAAHTVGDFFVTLQEEPGSVICWNSAGYFINCEE